MTISTVHIQHEIIIPDTLESARLDSALAELLPDYSRSVIKQWIEQGGVTRNQGSCKPRDKVTSGDLININIDIADRTTLTAEDMPLDIVFEDDDIIVINKPPGIVVHPGSGNWDGTLVNALLHHCPTLAKLPRAGLIHRIDKETSGLLVIAKTLSAHTWLVEQLQAREFKRIYWAVVQGEIISGGSIDAPIGRHPRQRTKMAVVQSGKPATTHYRIKERFPHYTLLTVQLETGRTHQIRVHLAHKGYSLIGDPTYSGRFSLPKQCPPELAEVLKSFKRQALHAQSLGFIHPKTKIFQEWTAPLPQDMLKLIESLRNQE